MRWSAAVPLRRGVSRPAPDSTFAETRFGGEPLRNQPLLTWCGQLLEAIIGPVLKAVPSH